MRDDTLGCPTGIIVIQRRNGFGRIDLSCSGQVAQKLFFLRVDTEYRL